jgi:hypothetical protein
MLGLCVSPGVLPSLQEVERLDPPFLRSILISLDDDLKNLLDLGRPLLISLNNECREVESDWSGWGVAVSRICELARGRLVGITSGNELDVYWSRNHDDTPPEFAAQLVLRAQAASEGTRVPIGTTSLGGSAWPDYLTQMLKECDPDFVAFNPYGWVFDGLDAKLAQVRAVAPGYDIKCSEVGAKLADVGGPAGQATAVQEAHDVLQAQNVLGAWFAWHDLNGAPSERGDQAFGLVTENNQRRPAWYTYQKLGQEQPPMPETHAHIVGPGVLAKMQTLGDEPASCEDYRTGPHNTQAEYSSTLGRSGNEYKYIFDTGETVVIGRVG